MHALVHSDFSNKGIDAVEYDDVAPLSEGIQTLGPKEKHSQSTVQVHLGGNHLVSINTPSLLRPSAYTILFHEFW
jgi:hypothetical protein